MILEKGHLYHIYNQGNNQQRIFFNRDNYMYFLKKVNMFMLPYVDIIAWCLMPNHFHFMVEVKELELEVMAGSVSSEAFTQGEGLTKSAASDGFSWSEAVTMDPNSQGFTSSEALTKDKESKFRTLNDSIGILLRTYTRAINKQENRSGSLFRNPTKAECITKLDGITPTFFNTSYGAVINVRMPEREYPQVCWNYIHNNPVAANMVKKPEDWEFSSYRDYCGLRNGKMINRERAEEFGIIFQ
jgi:putative transposase